MVIPDVNLLVYAYHKSSPYHLAAKQWLSTLLDGRTEVGFPLVSILGFIRLVSNNKIFETPISPAAACAIARSWLETPSAAIVDPGGEHLQILEEVLAESLTTSNHTTDAHIAALAREYNATIHSNDTDFGRFKKIRWVNPLE